MKHYLQFGVALLLTALAIVPEQIKVSDTPVPYDKKHVACYIDWCLIPSAHYIGDNTPPDQQLVDKKIKELLLDANALKAWQLCELELGLQATYFRSEAQAWTDEPINRPRKALHTPAEVAIIIGNLESQAKLYSDAAQVARVHKIECVNKQGNPAYTHTLTTEAIVEGVAKQLVIPDYSVARVMEYYLATGTDCEKLNTERKNNLNKEVPSVVTKEMDRSWGSRERLRRAAELTHITLLCLVAS